MDKQTQEALKMAIEIFTKFKSDYFHMTFGERWEKLDKAIDLVKEALEQPAQEPVAWQWFDSSNFIKEKNDTDSDKWRPLYTHPHQWQGLTDDEIVAKVFENDELLARILYLDGVSKALKQALKDKNNEH
jgi:hypothetical protein